jgi:hypothetical protein
MKNGERRARATLTVDEVRDGVGRPDNGGRGARTATVGFRPGDGVVGTSAVETGEARRFGQRRRRGRDTGARSRQRF